MHLNVIFSLTIQNNDNKNLTNHFTIEGSSSEKLFGVTVDSSFLCDNHITDLSLHEKCPNTELFLVRIFPYSDWIRRFTPEISVFSPNTGKYGPEITLYLNTFRVVQQVKRFMHYLRWRAILHLTKKEHFWIKLLSINSIIVH